MEILSRLDFVQILSIGISGFGFLLILLAFLLIYKEQNRPTEPRNGILSTIRFFMGLNFFSVIVVGLLGLPLISKNDRLTQEKTEVQQKLNVKSNELEVVQKGNELDIAMDTVNPNTISDQQISKTENYVQSLDSLAKSYTSIESPKADSINDLKDIISIQVSALKSDTSSLLTKKLAVQKINLTNSKLARVVKGNQDLE
jgi:hypothetical protein